MLAQCAQPRREAGMTKRAPLAGPDDRRAGAAQHRARPRARDARVEELAREQWEMFVLGQDEREGLELGALALVHRERPRELQAIAQRLDRERDELPLHAEQRPIAVRTGAFVGADDDALVAVEEAALIIVRRDHHGLARPA